MDRHQEFERLYAEHALAVRAYARRRIDPTTADDVLGDVFVVAWRRIGDVPADPRTWLLGIARKVLANQRRANERQVALLKRLAAEPDAAGPDDTGGVERSVLLALAALRPADREVLLLTSWEDRTPAQAAEILGVRPSTLSMRLQRARERLRRELDAPALPSPTRPTPHLRENGS